MEKWRYKTLPVHDEDKKDYKKMFDLYPFDLTHRIENVNYEYRLLGKNGYINTSRLDISNEDVAYVVSTMDKVTSEYVQYRYGECREI